MSWARADSAHAMMREPEAKQPFSVPGTVQKGEGGVPNVINTTAEVSIGGIWQTVPALNIGGTLIVARGKWLRIARPHEEDWRERELHEPETCVELLKKEASAGKACADIFSFGERLPATRPRFKYYWEYDSIAAIPVTTFKRWWDGLPQVTRKNVRRSQKRGVEVRIRALDDQLIQDIVELTKDSPVRQGRRFLHFGKSFEQTKKDQSTYLDRSDFICAYSGNELVGLLKIVYGENLASVLLFLPKAGQQDKRPANALIAKAVEICEARHISHLVFGRYRYGNKQHSSLLEFKLRNGFEEILVPRYYIPLTGWGAFCLGLRLHRGLVGLLPDRFLRAALAVRAKSYSLWALLRRRSSIAEQPNRIRQTERSNPPAGSPHSDV